MSRASLRSVLLTGGAGFIGVNVAAHLARVGWHVSILDNLSRTGSRNNLSWLLHKFPDRVEFVPGDVRNIGVVNASVAGKQAVIHLAAQVAVTSSVVEPRLDFEVNAFGTFNVLEAVRLHAPDATFLFASTNKVYGALGGWQLSQVNGRWEPSDGHVGVSESEPIDFHSPYGCSKGAADQYVRDYSRCFSLRTVVLRQSCVYGEHQFGNEDQGWVAHFAHSVVQRRPITIYGDGHQVRDLLDVRDLSDLCGLCIERIDDCSGRIFNVGGGPENSRSVLNVLQSIEAEVGFTSAYTFSDWRPGDQPYYVSDVSLAREVLDWRPRVDFDQGLHDLVSWVNSLQDQNGVLALDAGPIRQPAN
jgi:CDP-paratose 2-epimerase